MLEALTRRRWRSALLRAVLTLLPIIAWHTYVTRVRASDEYSRPAYAYQRAPYQYYNVSYAENALLVDPFRPELGRVNAGTVALRLTTNLPFLIQSVGQAVTTTKAQWRQLFRKTQKGVFGRIVIPPGVTIVPIFGFAALVIAGFFVLVGRRAWSTILLLLGSIALVWTTPWPAQFSRYLAPLIAFFDICFVVALSRLNLALCKRQPGRVTALARASLAAVLVLAFLMETYTAVRLFRERAQPDGVVFQPGKNDAYRLFAHEETWRAWEKAVHWIERNAPQDAIVATTAPHFCYLLTGRRAVLPPMESNPAYAGQLLEAVPVSYVIIDQLEFLDVTSTLREARSRKQFGMGTGAFGEQNADIQSQNRAMIIRSPKEGIFAKDAETLPNLATGCSRESSLMLILLSRFAQARSNHIANLEAAIEYLTNRFRFLLLGSFCLFYLVVTFATIGRKLIWTDEFFTLYLSRLGVRDLWAALMTGGDQHPLPFYLLHHFFLRVLGENPWALRLPATLGFLLMMLCIYQFVANRTSVALWFCGNVATSGDGDLSICI